MKKKKLYVLVGMLLTISLVCMACGSTQETAALPDDANESIQDDKDLENEELEDIRIHSVAVAFQLTYFETRYDAESEEGLELEPEETQAPSGLANADASNLQRSDLETAAEAALGE